MKVDLSYFFSDERKCSAVFIHESWLTVADLQKHIEKLFNLKNINLLTNDDCFLPPQESIRVLECAESVQAFMLAQPIPEGKRSSRNGKEKTTKKRKNRSLEADAFTSSTPNFAKRSKNVSILSPDPRVEDSTHQSEDHNYNSPFKQPTICGDENETLETPISSVTQRERTRKDTTNDQISTRQTEANESAFSQKSMSRQSKSNVIEQIQNKSKSSQIVQNTHTIFEDGDCCAVEASLTTTRSIEKIIFRCPLIDLDSNKPRIFKLPKKSQKIEILEHIVVSAINAVRMEEPLPAPVAEASVPEEQQTSPATTAVISQLVDSDSDDSVMVLDDTKADETATTQMEDSDSDIVAIPESHDETMEIIGEMLESAAPLTSLPNLGDTILFKLSKIKSSTHCGITEYIAATCAYVNRRTKALTFTIISCPDGHDCVLRQYRNNLNESDDTMTSIHLKFSDLIEPKVIVPTVE